MFRNSCRNAAVGSRWRGRRTRLVRIDVSRTTYHPNVIVLVGNHHRNSLDDPLVRQRLGPGRVDLVYRWVLGSRSRTNRQGQTAEADRGSRRRGPSIADLHGVFLRVMRDRSFSRQRADSSSRENRCQRARGSRARLADWDWTSLVVDRWGFNRSTSFYRFAAWLLKNRR